MEKDLNIEISETNRGKEQVILNRKYKSNFSYERKDKTKVYKCSEYKTSNKCKSLIILNNNKNLVQQYQ